MDTAPPSKADEASDDDSVVTVETPEASEGKKWGKSKASVKTTAAEARKPGKAKQASAETAGAKTLVSFAFNCDDVLAFLQAVSVNPPQVIAAPLSLRADKKARVWFQIWTDVHLPKPPTPAPQDHLGITDVLTDVATRLHTAEALCPVVATQHNTDK